MKVNQVSTGVFVDNKEIIALELCIDDNNYVRILSYGLILQEWIHLNKYGSAQNVVLGFDSVEDYFSSYYLNNYAYMGTIVGRYANRIKNARFILDGKLIQIAKNSTNDFIHGGLKGFDKQHWEFEIMHQSPNPTVKFSYLSKDGEEGFPGNLNLEIVISYDIENQLNFKYKAYSDKTTVINLTHHSYFNLNADFNSIQNHHHMIPADHFLEQEDNYCTTGNLVAVDEFFSHDFRQSKLIGRDWDPTEGYDQSYVLNKPYGSLGLASSTFSPNSGLRLNIHTTEPIAHFYTSKNLNAIDKFGKIKFKAFEGFCIETQHHPNAVNISKFPSTILKPGQTYSQETIYQLKLESTD